MLVDVDNVDGDIDNSSERTETIPCKRQLQSRMKKENVDQV